MPRNKYSTKDSNVSSLYDDYKSFGSFIPVYKEAIEKLLYTRDRVLMSVFLSIVSHADEHGLCWPGVDRLRRIAGYSEATVEASLDKLLEMDWIRGHVERNSLTGRESLTIQVSPYVMWIRPTNIVKAMENWQKATVRKYLSNVGQPTESDLGINNQPEEKPDDPTTTPENKPAEEPERRIEGEKVVEIG